MGSQRRVKEDLHRVSSFPPSCKLDLFYLRVFLTNPCFVAIVDVEVQDVAILKDATQLYIHECKGANRAH